MMKIHLKTSQNSLHMCIYLPIEGSIVGGAGPIKYNNNTIIHTY